MNPNASSPGDCPAAPATTMRAPLPALRLLGALLTAASLVVAVTDAPAAPPADNRRLTREIGVVEKVLDEMLLDSKNLLVYSTDHNARGLYLDEFGVILSFQASLVDRSDDMSRYTFGAYRIEDTGDKIVVYKNKDGAADKSIKLEEGDAASRKARKEQDTARLAGLYSAGKQEIIDVLLDYGTTLSSLRDDQWVAVGAFLKGHDFFQDRHISRLVLKARMSDLRAVAAGRLTRDAVAAKVVEEEY